MGQGRRDVAAGCRSWRQGVGSFCWFVGGRGSVLKNVSSEKVICTYKAAQPF